MGSGDANRVVSAIRFLQSRDLYYQFDKKERVVEVAVYDATGADEIAAHVGQLRDLRKLKLKTTDLADAGLRHLNDLVKIKELWLTSPKVTGDGLASLAGMRQMEELILEAPLDARGFEHISQLRNLVRLTVEGGNFCDDDMTPLGALVNLEELSLSETDNVNGTFCAHLAALPRLRRLTLGAHVTDAGLACIARLENLEDLSLEGPFTDVGLRQVRRLKKLKDLAIRTEQASHKGVAVVAELPELNYLSLDTPLLTDEAIPSLVRCSALETMVFRTPCVTDAGLQYLRDVLPNCGVGDFERDRREHERPTDDPDTARPRLQENTPFTTLLAEARDGDLVNGTFHKIGERYANWVDAAKYSPEESVIMLVWHSSGIIGNGGFEYLFAGEFPGDPDFHITAEAYRTAGLDRSYEAFHEAFKLFPGGVVPHDPEQRIQLYQAANKSAREGLNRKLWHDDHAQEKKLAEFIRKNAAQLGNLDATS